MAGPDPGAPFVSVTGYPPGAGGGGAVADVRRRQAAHGNPIAARDHSRTRRCPTAASPARLGRQPSSASVGPTGQLPGPGLVAGVRAIGGYRRNTASCVDACGRAGLSVLARARTFHTSWIAAASMIRSRLTPPSAGLISARQRSGSGGTTTRSGHLPHLGRLVGPSGGASPSADDPNTSATDAESGGSTPECSGWQSTDR